MEHIGEAIFDVPFMIQSHAKSMRKILGALQDLPANQHSQFSHNLWNWAELAVLVSKQVLKGFQDFLHTFSMALYHKWDVKNAFTYVLTFFSLISDGLGSVLIFRRYQILLWSEIRKLAFSFLVNFYKTFKTKLVRSWLLVMTMLGYNVQYKFTTISAAQARSGALGTDLGEM